MGRVIFRHKEQGTFQLQRLDVLEITSLAPRDAFFKPLSWRVNAGWERQWTAGDDVLVAQGTAGFGGTWSPTGSLSLYALATARVEQNHELERELDVAPGISLGLIAHTRLGATLASVDRYRFTNGVDRTAWSVGHNLPLGRDLALRLSFDRRISDSVGFSEAAVALRYHF
jgi:hypothetical protein